LTIPGTCFRVLCDETGFTWEEAVQKCAEFGGKILRVENEFDNLKVADQLPLYNGTWIDGSDQCLK